MAAAKKKPTVIEVEEEELLSDEEQHDDEQDDDDELNDGENLYEAYEAEEAEKPTRLPAKKTIPGGTTDLSKLDLLQRYFHELRKHPLLTKEQEYDLAVEFTEKQDPKLAYRLITSNLRLVVKIAMEYQSAVANLLDLIQEGNIGLMQAVKKFDPFRGIRLSSYAQWWIRAYILKYLVNNARMVKVGTTQAQRKLFFNLRKEKDRLESLGFKPEPSLLAARLDVKVEEVNEMEKRLSRSDISLDAPVGNEQKSTVADFMADTNVDVEKKVIENELRNQIRGHMEEFSKTLKERETIIWEKRLTSDEPLTLQEIGDVFGVTRERARQIEKDITKRFRDYLQKQLPDLDAYDMLK